MGENEGICLFFPIPEPTKDAGENLPELAGFPLHVDMVRARAVDEIRSNFIMERFESKSNKKGAVQPPFGQPCFLQERKTGLADALLDERCDGR